MKVPPHKIEFKTLDEGYGSYFATIPRSLPEGTLNFIQGRNIESDRMAARIDAMPAVSDIELDATQKARESLLAFRRETNAMVLDLIEEWNIDDANGKPLELPRDAKNAKRKIEIMSELPLEVIGLIASEIWNPSKKEAVSEETKDFSSESSAAA